MALCNLKENSTTIEITDKFLLSAPSESKNLKTYLASEVCQVTITEPRAGMPSWTNLSSRTKINETTQSAELSGGGVYACFWDSKLIYIGKFTGTKLDPLGGCVVDRIHKHMIGFTLRAQKLFFNQSVRTAIENNLPDISEAGRRIAQDIAAAGPEIVIDRGNCATFNKARFASLHWDEIEHLAPEKLAERFSFLYKRVDLGGKPCPPKATLDKKLIEPIETELIHIFEPICNTKGRRDADGDPVSQEIVAQMFAKIFREHQSRFYSESAEDLTPQSLAESDAEPAEWNDDDSDPIWPDATDWDVYTIKNGQLRVRHTAGNRPVLLVRETKHSLNCLAPVESLTRRGVAAKAVSGRGPMVSQVRIDWACPETPQIIRQMLEAATTEAAAQGKIPALAELVTG